MASLPRPLLGSLVLVLACGCASTPFDVAVYVAPGADFSGLGRAAFADGPTAGPALHEEPLDRRAARRALRERLQKDGYRFTEPADFRVRFQVGSVQHVPVDDEYRIAGGLRVEILDASGDRVLWRGWAGETVSDCLEPEKEIRAAVDLLMDRFPPPMR